MPVCHNYHRVHPRLRGVRMRAATGFPSGTLSPAQILTAYGFRQNQFAGAKLIKLGVGSLGGEVVTPPTPPTPPTPAKVTLTQAQAWANAGLAANWPKGQP